MLGVQAGSGAGLSRPLVPRPCSADQPLLFFTAESFKEFAELLQEVELERSMMVR